MIDYRFERNARKNRRTALYFTILFHALLIGGLAYSGSGGNLQELLPAKVKAWLGLEQPDQAAAQVKDMPRP
ncbi:MAG: hypothetical protein H6564_17560 [Lewinellaceae bacterium]|nr:hypothetical protein [Lewinellaceae bacterium]